VPRDNFSLRAARHASISTPLSTLHLFNLSTFQLHNSATLQYHNFLLSLLAMTALNEPLSDTYEAFLNTSTQEEWDDIFESQPNFTRLFDSLDTFKQATQQLVDEDSAALKGLQQLVNESEAWDFEPDPNYLDELLLLEQNDAPTSAQLQREFPTPSTPPHRHRVFYRHRQPPCLFQASQHSFQRLLGLQHLPHPLSTQQHLPISTSPNQRCAASSPWKQPPPRHLPTLPPHLT
jgi:hypothetical protein